MVCGKKYILIAECRDEGVECECTCVNMNEEQGELFKTDF